MKCLSYEGCEDIRELILLCKKVLQSGDTCAIVAPDQAQALSEGIWKTQPFLPHGLDSEPYSEIQPVLITSKYCKRPVIINFERIHVSHSQINCKVYILWNVQNPPGGFARYIYTNGKWTSIP